MTNRLAAILGFFCFMVSACATVSRDGGRRFADEVALQAWFQKDEIKTKPFFLATYSRITRPGSPLRVYFEGDGYAWVTPTRPSGDPTPRDPMVLRLAAEDPAPNVVYLARPCQYTSRKENPACEEFFWTSGRFSETVVKSMNDAVSYLVANTGAPGVELIGYSGGAALAVLVAERRQDVLTLRTIAGNLDPETVNRYHGVGPLEGSLDPGKATGRIVSIPQIHFVGGNDTVIPLTVAESFLKKMGSEKCFQMKVVPEASHTDGWTEVWDELLRMPVTCREMVGKAGG